MLTQTWLSDPAYASSRNAYYEVRLACGHGPADPTMIHDSGIPVTTGYGTDRETGEYYCHECCAARDLARMAETGRGFAYLVERPLDATKPGSKIYMVTTWPGVRLGGKVVILNRWRDNFGGTRVAFRVKIGAEVWSGSGPGVGMYCRLRRTKLSAL